MDQQYDKETAMQKDELFQQLRQQLHNLSRVNDEFLHNDIQRWMAAEPIAAKEMLSHESSIDGYIHSTNPRQRCIALEIAIDFWKQSESRAADCERLAFEDEDEMVKLSAINRIGVFFFGTQNSSVVCKLHNLVENSTGELKASAYIAMRRVLGTPCSASEIIQFHSDPSSIERIL